MQEKLHDGAQKREKVILCGAFENCEKVKMEGERVQRG